MPELCVRDSVFINDAIRIVGREVTGVHRLHAPGYRIEGITWERDPNHIPAVRETSGYGLAREGLEEDVVHAEAV